jgi:ABC-2 type transport system ATP-binding protein
MPSNSPVISVENLTKRFGDFTAVDSITFHVNRGEIFGFLGPNGSGKTTTIRMKLGLMQPTEGTARVLGMDVSRHKAKILPRVGYMSQRFSLYNDLTVQQNLRFYGRAYGLGGGVLKERMGGALEMAGLSGRERALTGELSGGWRQRLALGVAILHRPEVIFLDEPTAGVDPLSRRAFWDLLYDLVDQGITIFVTTHYMDEAEHCHRLAFIQRGRIIATGSPAEIKRDLMSGQVLEIEPADPVGTVAILRKAADSGRLPLVEVELYGSLVHAVAQDMANLRQDIARELRQAGVEPGNMRIVEPSLEDVFIAGMK